MKKTIFTAAAVLLVVVMAGASFAGNIGGTVTVQATIVGQCKAIGGNNIAQTRDFGTITVDETTGNQTSALAATSIKCTNGLPYTISYTSANDSGVQRRMKFTDAVPADHFLNYSYTPSVAAGSYIGAGFGAAAISIAGSVDVLGADLQAAWSDSAAGVTYQDTVVVDLAF